MKRIILSAIALISMGLANNANAQSGSKNVNITTYTYAVKGQDSLKLDIYLREDLKAGISNPDQQKLPVMMYVHGGGFVGGSRINAAQEVFLRHYAEQGYMGVSIDYRLAGMTPEQPVSKYGCKSTAEVIQVATHDMADATAWLLKNYPQIDAKKIFTSGGSAGAFTILQIEYDICNNAPYILENLPKDFNYAGIISAAGSIYVMPDEELTFQRKPCPIFFLQGSEDKIVSEEAGWMLGIKMFRAETLHKIFSEKQFPHWTYIEKGADHVVAMSHLTDNLEETDKFIRKFVNEGKPACVYTEWQAEEPAGMADVNAMIKWVPLYILGYDKYLKDLDFNNIQKPQNVVY